MKLRVIALLSILSLITTMALFSNSISVSQGYDYGKYDPILIALRDLKHDYY